MKYTLRKLVNSSFVLKKIIKVLSFFPFLKPILSTLKYYGWVTIKFNFNGSIKTFKIYSYGDCIENDFYWNVYDKVKWEYNLRILWAGLSSNSKVCFDIGANSGFYSLMAMSVGCKNIYSFEPFKKNYILLLNNAKKNNYPLNLINSAVSNSNGENYFYYSNKYQHNYSPSLNESFVLDQYGDIERTIVNTLSLYSLCNTFNPDLFKIDIEGFEFEVLFHIADYIKSFRPLIIVEFIKKDISSFNNIFYEYTTINIDDLRKINLKSTNQISANVLFIPNEKKYLLNNYDLQLS